MALLNKCRKFAVFKESPLLQTARHLSSSLKSVKVSVEGRSIHVVRRGNGPKAVLLMPGALGTATTDLLPQLEGLCPRTFSLVGWDPPGYGDSRPPARDFDNFFQTDADMAVATMKRLGFSRFSMLGWSDGGITALCAAILHPKAIEKVVVWGSNAYIVQADIDMIKQVEDVSKWSPRMREPMEAVYGVEGFPKLWSAWCRAYVKIWEEGGEICSSQVDRIGCPALVIHGQKDAMVAEEHVHFLHEAIPFASKYIFEDGKHNLHLKYKDQFNALVSDFLAQGNVNLMNKCPM